MDGSLAACSVSETVISLADAGPDETSTMGPSLVDSDDELLASLLPGYLNSFQNLVKFHFGNIFHPPTFVFIFRLEN